MVERPWRNWIAHRSSEPRVVGSNPTGRALLNNGKLLTASDSRSGMTLQVECQSPDISDRQEIKA